MEKPEDLGDIPHARVGNGGFSLRKVIPCYQYCIENSDKNKNLMMSFSLLILVLTFHRRKLHMILLSKLNYEMLSHQSHPWVSIKYGVIRENLGKKILNDG